MTTKSGTVTAEGGRRYGVGVVGGSGYIGGELLRYLCVHPRVELRWVTAHSHVNEQVADLLPNLAGFVDKRFVSLERAAGAMGGVDAVFVALPHTKSQELIPQLATQYPQLRCLDMGGDFRTPDPEGYKRYYGEEHKAPDWLARFVFGFTEFQRERLKTAQLVANPGCFASALLVALAPLARAGRLAGPIFASGVTGSSGSGNLPSQGTHHPERAATFRAYKPLAHQHHLEVEHFTRTLSPADFHLHFVPQSGPFVRGIFTTVFVPGLGLEELERIYGEAYGSEPLIRVRPGSPELRLVQGTPRTEIGLAADDRCGLVFVALDNLGKGAAGQAIQNFNLMFGLEETSGLLNLPGGFV